MQCCCTPITVGEKKTRKRKLMSSDDETLIQSEEEDIGDFNYSTTSIKDVYYVIHRGSPPITPSSFATVSKKTRWPDDLWRSGTLVYDIQDPSKSLGPPTSQNDTILRFESRFESGNLSRAFHLSGDKYHLILEYDHNSIGSAQWFYFRISNTRKDAKYTFIISGFHKKKSLFCTGSKVFWYSEKQARRDNISWQRGGTNYQYGTTTRKRSKKKRASVQFNIKFPYSNDQVYLCYALPYTYSDLTRFTKQWQATAGAATMVVETLGQTLGGRDCPIYTITSPHSSIPMNSRPYIFVTARIHPGESNGSYLMHGFMDYLLGGSGASKYLLDHYIFKIIPMMNIDGVVEGFYRISLSGNDLNRIWTEPDPVLHPIIFKAKNLFTKLSKEREVAMYLDFHGHARLHGTFAFGCPNTDDPQLRDKEKNYPRILSFLSDAFAWQYCVFSYPSDRKSAARIVVRSELNVVQSFTIETSFGGLTSGPRAGVLYDEISWKELGQKCCEATFHYLCGNDSPITSYVAKELSFLAPSDPPKKSDNWAPKARLPPDDAPKQSISFALNGRKGQGMFRLGGPTSYLKVSPQNIETTQTTYKFPKWQQMKYTLN
ncbi:Clan MC, family M14, Zinc carboxypeptidase-like metallopeptidase [Trichomonas vaginalis G3]|uniref:Clan MC, family M14, Zinc carboxypeptidase-like metallopeptidase n=1 Tax=Trichomonas vaginalis (strain ATCC PRA-98 / G3) TaxID=412133 RepID=A2DME1_TRIV3|nr:cytosolic carboxypeptidase family [Trichomonas vaginalis G3]EAY18368.1 Clan MC, family M14, Zinc carboxypeptidase-like metallopeptidase [Trichomonas vaginalis G3]KAI5524167.1 cytosolic carboxypeptidase family [Trichomonas vaginalis G3]|eukprot:XP_001579354.1 Clan MC, family M14, Zinc carboxypeptidase-like metallopeptidase [Trichomonas vaginalis G3]